MFAWHLSGPPRMPMVSAIGFSTVGVFPSRRPCVGTNNGHKVPSSIAGGHLVNILDRFSGDGSPKPGASPTWLLNCRRLVFCAACGDAFFGVDGVAAKAAASAPTVLMPLQNANFKSWPCPFLPLRAQPVEHVCACLFSTLVSFPSTWQTTSQQRPQPPQHQG